MVYKAKVVYIKESALSLLMGDSGPGWFGEKTCFEGGDAISV